MFVPTVFINEYLQAQRAFFVSDLTILSVVQNEVSFLKTVSYITKLQAHMALITVFLQNWYSTLNISSSSNLVSTGCLNKPLNRVNLYHCLRYICAEDF